MRIVLGIVLSSLFFISACSKEPRNFVEVFSLPKIQKLSFVIPNRMEATPINWHDGRELLVVSKREGAAGTAVEIWEGEHQLKTHSTNLGLISAIVNQDTLIVFGVTSWGTPGNAIYSIQTSDLETWTEPKLLWSAKSNQTIYNTSVAAAPGGFIMAYEVCEPGTVCFSSRFLTSSNLEAWQSLGDLFMADKYLGCPTIRFYNGFYYVFYLGDLGHHATLVARSQDLISWEHSPKAVLSALDRSDEGLNNSDMDLEEKDGKTRIIYAFGSQTSGWADIRVAEYDGAISSFLNEFF